MINKGKRFIPLALDRGLSVKEASALSSRFNRHVRLLYLRSIAKEIERLDEMALWERFLDLYQGGFKCQECARIMTLDGKENQSIWTIDHVFPVCKGGGNGQGNLRFICFECNTKKGQRLVACHG